MKDVSRDKGRTIIFVSHNMQAVNNLCQKAIWLKNGKIEANGNTQTVVNEYLSAHQQRMWKQEWSLDDAPGNEFIKILSVELLPNFIEASDVIDTRSALTVRFRFSHSVTAKLAASLCLFTLSEECIFDMVTKPSFYDKGIITGQCTIPGNFLNDGSYYFSIGFLNESLNPLFSLPECLHFDVEDYREDTSYFGKWKGYVRPSFPFVLARS